MNLSIVIPAFNEKESLPELVTEITDVCEPLGHGYEILIVDDGSTDGTFAWVKEAHEKDPRISGLRLRMNCGKARALNLAFRKVTGDVVITMDGDLQDNPKEIPAMLAMLEEGADMVSGWKKKRHDPIGKTLPSRLFNITVRLVSGLKLHDFNCGFKAYRRELTDSLHLYGELHRYIPVLAHWNGFTVHEKVVEHRPRKFGRSKYGWARLTNGFFDLVTLLFLHRYTSRPLHLFGLIGLAFTLVGSVILGYFLLFWIVTGGLHVRPLLLGGVACILLGFQVVSLGLLAEMIAQKSSDEAPLSEETGIQT